MIGLDTNLLIRYLTKDDRAQYAKAKRLIDEAVEQDERLLINGMVLCEVTWCSRPSRYSRRAVTP
jgi:predicted nucleic-acid-binding protein